MPEYLAPGVFVEEVSYRSKSIEGVSTTTTGFVGPTRYGPVEIEPEVITNVAEFERIYSDGSQLTFGSDDGSLHNYMWHGVRGFFEEGGKRLYVARTFRPLVSTGDGRYKAPPEMLKDDHALPSNGSYETDGHARCWLTPQTAAMSNVLRAVDDFGGAVREANQLMGAVTREKDISLPLQFDSGSTPTPNADADTKVATAAGLLQRALDDSLTACLAVQDAIATAQTAQTAQGMSAGDVISQLGLALPLAENGALPEADLAQTDEIIALKATSKSSEETADAAMKLLSPLMIAAAQVIADEGGAGSDTEIAKFADAINKSCAAPDGDVYLKLDAALTAAGGAATAAEDAENPATIQTAKTAAVDLVASSSTAANACNALAEVAQRLLNQAFVDRKQDDPAHDEFPLRNIVDLVAKVKVLASKADSALQAAQRGVYLRAWFVEQTADAMKSLLEKFDALATAGASSKAALDSHVPLSTAEERVGAILLRARFPGAAGDMSIRFNLNLGQNGLVADPQNAAKNKVPGLTPGDAVWIGTKSDTTGRLYLAYPKQDGSDWYFSTDTTPDNAAFWLNQPPNSSSAKLQPNLHEVRTVTATVDVIRQNGIQTWSGLALQPNHRRAGSADSITAKFAAATANGTDARTLPFVMLLEDEVDLAGEVYTALFARDPAVATTASEWPLSATHRLTGGNDGRRPGAAEYAGGGEGPDAAKTGLKALEDMEDISIVAAPGAMFGYMNGYRSDAQQIVSSLIGHAENMKYRIAVLESGDGQSIADVREMRARYDSKYAALYYPWVRVLDPVTRDEIHLPPSGFVAGIYARNDIDRAVYKAPANEVVRSAIGFQAMLNKAQQEVLNPEGVNCFRFFEGRGFRLWGARTISSDPEWKYVNVRRYFAYLEHSIDRGTQWAVFEPNGEALWANVRETISDFLYNEWKNGALLGSDPKTAYFVRCDRSTMTQNDLDNGRLICKIGVAALKPAEFVIFQIGQWTGDRKA
jgi:hypothetical protein